MLKMLPLIGLLCLVGCATKLRTPLNRMVSPETVGGSMSPEFELSQQQQLNGTVDTSGSEPYDLDFTTKQATGFYGALSLTEVLDVTWQHTASAVSLVGLKWQFLGGSLKQAGAGHSMAVMAAFGGNEHEIDGDTQIKFNTSASDFSLIHGYWFTPFWQVFETLGYSRYGISGKLSGDDSGDFSDEAKHLTLAGGTALLFKPYRLKLEIAYTEADWSESGKDTYLSWAFGVAAFF